MATIRTNPDGWQEVLDALANDDIELARQKVVEHRFDKDEIIKTEEYIKGRKTKANVYTYFMQKPNGEIKSSDEQVDLVKLINRSRWYISNLLNKRGSPHVVEVGDLKGWKFWRERIK